MFTTEKKWTKKSDVNVLVVGVSADDAKLPEALDKGNKTLQQSLERQWENGSIATKQGEVTKMAILEEADGLNEIFFVGLGDTSDQSETMLKENMGHAVKAVNKQKQTKVGVILDTFNTVSLADEALARAFSEAILTSSYRFDAYKTKKDEKPTIDYTLYIESGESDAVEASLNAGQAVGRGVNFARTLVNIPGSDLTPNELADEAKALANRHDALTVEVLDKDELEELGMHALLAVNRGADQPAKMIVLRYQGKEHWEEPLAFVGKGITYDSGGYSLKPADGMKTMKMDMGGAAAVLGAMETIGERKPRQNVLAIIPSTENPVNGSAMKPGDVLHSFDGQTIEVNNTDAEGRLILADGVAYARHLGANKIVDVATLTGACVVALGDVMTGAVSNDDQFYESLSASADETGEPVWRFPTHARYEEMLRSSDVADLNNAPGRQAGSITAGLFIKAFVHDIPWVHLDIAGTAFLDRDTPLGPKGATGVMVRTLSALAQR